MRLYFIRGLIFLQRELTYPEDAKVKDILSKYVSYFANIDDAFDYGKLVDRIFEDGLIPKLFAIVLKESIFAVWNAPVGWLFGIDRKNIINHSKNSVIARILWDFFLINTKQIRKYANSRKKSGLRNPLTALTESLSGFMNYSTGSQRETTTQ